MPTKNEYMIEAGALRRDLADAKARLGEAEAEREAVYTALETERGVTSNAVNRMVLAERERDAALRDLTASGERVARAYRRGQRDMREAALQAFQRPTIEQIGIRVTLGQLPIVDLDARALAELEG